MASTRRNFRRAARKVNRYRGALTASIPSGLRLIGEEIMTDVKASRPGHGVPVDEGTLRNSGRVTGPRSDDTVLLSFGDAAAPYALRQHQEMDYAHAVGEARYLTRGVDRWLPDGSAAIDALRKQADEAAKRIEAQP